MSGQPIIIRSEKQRDFAMGLIGKLRIDPVKPFVVTIDAFKKKRSLSQNALMWVRYHELAKIISDDTGSSVEDIHDYCKMQWIKPKISEAFGVVIERRTTTDLTAAEMKEFMDKVEGWAASEFGVALPHPEDREFG